MTTIDTEALRALVRVWDEALAWQDEEDSHERNYAVSIVATRVYNAGQAVAVEIPALLDALAERDAEVARLRERERTLIRVKDADLDDLRHEVEARDALVTNIAKIAAAAEAEIARLTSGAAWFAEQGVTQAFPQDDFPCCSTGGDCPVGAA